MKSGDLPRLKERLESLLRLGNLGITARLSIALISVAALAATANLYVDSGVTLVQMFVDRPVVAVPTPRLAPVQPPVVRAPAEPPQVVQGARELATALTAFDRVVRSVVEGGAVDSTTSRPADTAALIRATEAFSKNNAAKMSEATILRDAVLAHERESIRLLRATRARRDATDDYSTNLAAMSARVQKSIDGAWKIMGRVIARQSLMKLSAELDAIQSTFARRDVSESAAALAARLVPPEQAFALTLQKNADALARSQGAVWVEAMRADMGRLTVARLQMTQTEQQRTRLATNYFAESARLIGTLNAFKMEPRAPMVVVPPLASQSAAPVVTQPVMAQPVVAPAISTSEGHGTRRPVVATMSLVVLAVLMFLSLSTILGVVRQVRRLVAATRRIANGETVMPVSPGGIRELDTIGIAIGSMARQLAVAQMANHEAQRRLEGTVAERTRDLKELAERDPLTGLPNRRQLFAALDASIERARTRDRLVGVFYLDVDNFKTLNDSLGHTFGDRVLMEIGRRLETAARSLGLAGRLGGDEFMIIQEEAYSVGEVEAAGTLVVGAFEKPIEVDGREIIVSVSVGASVFPEHEQDAGALVRAADAALFSAKELGRSRLSMFTPELLVRVSAKFAIEQKLRRALEKREFELFYQPEVNLQTLEVSLVEALIRWRMPDGSVLCPGEFLAVAEEFGLMREIDDWVLETAIEAAATWRDGPWPSARVAVNVSPRQLLDQRFVANLTALLGRFRLPAKCLELELTESVLQTGPGTIKALAELRALGVSIALDDFGSGFSSISSLEQLPLTRVKLDRSLIARMDSSARSASIARATLGLCTELGLAVTAEGVERIEQFSALLGFGTISLQGYLLSEPLPPDRLLAALERMPAHCQALVLSCRTLDRMDALSTEMSGGGIRKKSVGYAAG